MRPIIQANCFLVFGVIIGVISIVMMATFDAIYQKVLNDKLVIDPENKIYKVYTNPSVPMNLDFYFFNVTNSYNIQNFGEKPKLTEIGPYRYLEKVKKNGTFNHTQGTFKYTQSTTYFFDKENSKGSEDDIITTLNPVLLVIADKLDSLSPAIKAVAELFFMRFAMWDDLFIKRKVSQLLFQGYYDPLVELSGQISGDPEKAAGMFGYYYNQNGSNDGVYEVYTGENGMENYLFVKTWNGSEELDYWGYNGTQDDKYCNMINGTDGTQFPPGVTKDKLVQIFTTDLCRSIRLYFDSEIRLHKAKLYHFVLDSSLLKITPPTKCFCKDEFTCRDSMVNVKACKKGAPLILSTPHFYEGTQEDIDSVEGLSPSSEKHETYLDIEPTTGVVMRGAKRIQLNLPLKNYGSLSTFQNVPEVIFPILWADENAVIPEKDANNLNDALTVPYLIIYTVFGIILVIAVIFVITGIILRDRAKKNTKAGLLMK